MSDGWLVSDFPDPMPGFPASPRPGRLLPGLFTAACLAAMPAGVAVLVNFSRIEQKGVAAGGLVLALAGFVGVLYWANRLRNRWAWAVGRILPARVVTAQHTDITAVGMKVGLRSLGIGGGLLASGVGDASTPVSVQYLEAGLIHYVPVRGEGATRRWRPDDIVWVVIHKGVLPLVLCAPKQYLTPVPQDVESQLRDAISALPQA